MGNAPDNISARGGKIFKVILQGIDPAAATPESFVTRLSAKTRVSETRIRSLVAFSPCTLKSHLTALQANRLKGLLEEAGGKVRVEEQSETPSGDGISPGGRVETGPSLVAENGGVVCPECGWEAEAGAKHCALCLRKFRDPASRPRNLEQLRPEKNPLDDDWDPSGSARSRTKRNAGPYLLLVVFGIVAAVLVFLLTK